MSLDAAFTSDGDLDTDLFHPQLAADLERMLVELHDPELGCSHFGSRFIAGPKYARGTSLRSVSRGSAAVISGSVDGRDYGFDRGWPGQLLRIRVAKRLSGQINEEVVYAFIPVARFTLPDGRVVCAEAPGYADPPQIGDSVVLFVPEHEGGDFVDLQGPNSIVVLHATGHVALPAEISKDEEAAVAARKGVPAFLDELARQLALPVSAEGAQ